MAGAPSDNQNAREGRRWREAIRRALSRAAGDIDRGLDRIADRLVARAATGDAWAIDHLAERMDGKPDQKATLQVDHIVHDQRVRETREELRSKASEISTLQ